jgi:hypothetical protein
MCGGIVVGLHSSCMKINPLIPAKLSNELAIAVGFFAAELEVYMCYTDSETRPKEKVDHYHRVKSTAHGKQNTVLSGTQRMLPDEFCKSLQHKGKDKFYLFLSPL